ncbi:unnamed protein product [Pseudo-nitzschia multistriata]|uniref:Uncharacterized protein n=1 Tax=Pseudo-nitzschia multistriata TaxID=183589 RepID=A0A448Z3I8_9STRA|nr:unnamed protein product [Pseudo-nitzschia multistriata]
MADMLLLEILSKLPWMDPMVRSVALVRRRYQPLHTHTRVLQSLKANQHRRLSFDPCLFWDQILYKDQTRR